jgi:hypothetical protein
MPLTPSLLREPVTTISSLPSKSIEPVDCAYAAEGRMSAANATPAKNLVRMVFPLDWVGAQKNLNTRCGFTV